MNTKYATEKRRHSKDQPGFREASTKKNARRALKKQEVPSDRPKKEIHFAPLPAESTGGKQKQSGKGKNIKQTKKKLALMLADGKFGTRKYKRLANKLGRLEDAEVRAKARVEANKNEE